MNNKISIIIPVYNEEKYIKQCLDSVLMQTYRNLEIICVDDGSTDGSAKILSDYANRDDRIKIVTQKNEFAGVARNRGIGLASGDYLFFLDSDDYIDREFCEKMLTRAIQEDADITICRYYEYDEIKQKRIKPLPFLAEKYSEIPEVFRPGNMSEWIYYICGSWAWDKLYKRSFINRTGLKFQDNRVANDGFFVDISLILADTVSYTNEELVTHRVNVMTSLENTRYDYWECGVRMLRAEKEEMVKHDLYDTYKKAFVFHSAAYLMWQIRTMNTGDGIRSLFESIKNDLLYSLDLVYVLDCEPLCQEEAEYKKEILAIRDCKDIVQYLVYVKDILNQEHRKYNEWINELLETVRKKHWRIRDDIFGNNVRLIIYGYGDVGHDLVEQIEYSCNMSLAGIIDRKKSALREGGFIDINQVKDIEYDYIIIAISDKKISFDVKRQIISMGIEEERVLGTEAFM